MGVRIDLRMYIRTWPSATLMQPYVQVNANKHDSHMPRVPDARNLAFTEQTKQPGTQIEKKNKQVEFGCENRPPYVH